VSAYFDKEQSLDLAMHHQIHAELRTIALRYIGANPPGQSAFRVSLTSGFRRQDDYRYVFDLGARFPDAQLMQYAYAWGKLWRDEAGEITFSASAIGPMTVWCNGEMVFHSNYEEERDPQRFRKFNVQAKAGWNEVAIEFVKTTLGFGGIFGTGRFKNFPFHFIMPLAETDGWEGWAYSAPGARLEHPDFTRPDWWQGLKWLPRTQWTDEEKAQGNLGRIYGLQAGKKACGWTQLFLQPGMLTVKGKAAAHTHIFIDAEEHELTAGGSVTAEIPVSGGWHNIFVLSVCGADQWGFELTFWQNGRQLKLLNPAGIMDYKDPWLYLGCWDEQALFEPAKLTDITQLHDDEYWRVDVPQGYLRPFLERNHFGKWNYPLGVTLYGLLAMERVLKMPMVLEYLLKHVETATKFYDYSLWDRKKFGAAGINNQLSNIDSLDDCGSFASLMLELDKDTPIGDCDKIAAYTADYIEHKQSRLADGALCRGKAGLAEMNGTMWADDLYMSVPFLCRYYQRTGDRQYLDDAAKQFLLFKKYLYMPEQQIMSHVYLTDRKLANHIPWGRGNGWVLFSLSELLQVMDWGHPQRDELLHFFQDLCAGYLKLQDEHGMWHQVLNDPTSYQEASCTAMFTSAFARGIRNGWLMETEQYIEAVERGWMGLTTKAVDRHGNVYGICQGSGYSFRSTYYRDELTWVLNDPHGIGIVLMAGTETLKLRQWLSEQ
jgi:rhamnogalacturonyl hydrolase YesR